MTMYEFNILMHTKVCSAYSSIKKGDYADTEKKFTEILEDMRKFYAKD